MKRGKSERYLKDEKALEDYLVGEGLEDAVLVTGDNASRGGADLRDIVETARRITAILKGLHSRYPRFIVEQAAIAGALNPKVLKDGKQAQAAAAYIAKRLDALSEETERGWHGEALPEGGLRFWRELRGVMESHLIDGPFIASRRCAQARLIRRSISRRSTPSPPRSSARTCHLWCMGRASCSMR